MYKYHEPYDQWEKNCYEYPQKNKKEEIYEEGMEKDEVNKKCCYGKGLDIASQCVVEVCGHFYLLVELEASDRKADFERLIIIEITRQAYEFLLSVCVPKCHVYDSIPEHIEKKLKLKCTFIVENKAYIVFEVSKCGYDKMIIVKSPICNQLCK